MSEPFVVRFYTEDEGPILKGNGFDGCRIGEDREEAERVVSWINVRIAALEAENARLREDAERYRMLRRNGYLDAYIDLHPCDESKREELIDAKVDKFAAIDAARKGG